MKFEVGDELYKKLEKEVLADKNLQICDNCKGVMYCEWYSKGSECREGEFRHFHFDAT